MTGRSSQKVADQDAAEVEAGQKSGISDKQAEKAAEPMHVDGAEQVDTSGMPDWDIATQGQPPAGFRDQYNVYDSNEAAQYPQG
jgi:hypothetical protein